MRDRTVQLLEILQFLDYARDKITMSIPQVNEVAQGASMSVGLPVVLADCVTTDRNRESPLA